MEDEIKKLHEIVMTECKMTMISYREIEDRFLSLEKKIAHIENENMAMYAALVEASNLGGSAGLRCTVELQRIARNDASTNFP